MDIAKNFWHKIISERVLRSEQSATGNELKKQKEENRSESTTSTLGDGFAEGLKKREVGIDLPPAL